MAQSGNGRPRNPVRGVLHERPPHFKHRPLPGWPERKIFGAADEEAEQKAVVKKLREKFGGEITGVSDFRGDLAVTLKKEKILEICEFLRDDPELRFDMLSDLCGVDYMGREPRFETVYHLYSIDKKHRLRLKVPLEESDAKLDSVTGVWLGANWFEREAFDLFGIGFDGHPNLRKILTHEDFAAHALRKDHDPGKRFALKKPLEMLYARRELDEAIKDKDDPLGEQMILNIGPSHPATHGTHRFQVVLDGEKIVRCRPEIGYLHRCFEKMCETHTYQQAIPYTDRLNYCSSFMNNVGFCLAAEKLLGIEAPPRARHIRVILSEFNR
ncbi:MAG: NADH-quinone oxidoreductase subunit C, partial [bacterium]